MTKRILASLTLALLLASTGPAVQYDELSEDARELVPEGDMVVVTGKDGTRFKGVVVSETADKVVVKIRKSGAVSMSKAFNRNEIRSMRRLDLAGVFGAKLLEFEIDDKKSLTEAEYRRILSLFAEYMEKCKGDRSYGAVRKRFLELGDELKKAERGLKKIEGEWLTPVRAAVKEFDLYTRQMDVLRGRGDFSRNRKVRAFYERIEEKRRAAARSLPGLMQTRVPRLLQEKEFGEASVETVAFLQFWIAQVVKSEGKVELAIKEMDFDYILRMENKIIESYREAGKGKEKVPGVNVPRDMIYIPGGYFLMGKQGEDPKQDDFPMHIVFVSPFLIDKYEVTNEDYRKFVEHVKTTGDYSTAHPDAPPLKEHEPDGWQNSALSGDRQPVVGVDWYDAYAYTKWIDKRLPTEAEWEKAARGMDGRAYSWGEGDPTKGNVNWQGAREWLAKEMDRQNPPRAPDTGLGCACVKKEQPPPPPTRLPVTTWEVDKTLPQKTRSAIEAELFEWDKEYSTPYGVVHLAGNAAEWVHDVYSNDYYTVSAVKDPQGPKKGDDHVFRGGSYLTSDAGQLMTYWRGHPRDKREARGCSRSGQPMVGIRCARSLGIARRDEDDEPEVTFEQLMEELSVR